MAVGHARLAAGPALAAAGPALAVAVRPVVGGRPEAGAPPGVVGPARLAAHPEELAAAAVARDEEGARQLAFPCSPAGPHLGEEVSFEEVVLALVEAVPWEPVYSEAAEQ